MARSCVLRAVVGATFSEPAVLTDRDGTPTDLTGASLRWLAKARRDDSDASAVLEATSAGGTIVVVSATLGSIRFAIPAATMATIDPSRTYAWTLQVEAGGNVVRYPDAFQSRFGWRPGDGPGTLIVAASAIVAVP